MTLLHFFGALLIGYLLGSISAAILASKLMGLSDPRSYGSGSPGATNVLRSGNKGAAIITLLGDALKGWLAVMLAKGYLHVTGFEMEWLPAVAGLGAFLGHLYPLYFGFKGGKGVATAFGVLLGASWPVFIVAGVTWLAMAYFFRISSLAALTAFVAAPMYALLFTGSNSLVFWILVMAALIVWRHKANIQRLMNGQEPKIGEK
jgi:glycerol-3-phosphate acyltransferase PlsY